MGLSTPLDNYIEFMKTGKEEVLTTAAHSQINIMGLENGTYTAYSTKHHISESTSSKKYPNEQAKYEIEGLDVTGNVGIGKVVITHSDSTIVSYVSLIQINKE